jgi:Tfp pilus assembly protein PilN
VRPVNLIPPEERHGERTPARTGPLAYIIVGVLAAGLLMVSVMILTNNQISDRESEIASLEAQEASAQQEATRLSSYAQFASLEQARIETVTSLAQSRFDWDRVLRELAIVIPVDVQLTELDGKVSSDTESSSSSSSTSSSSSDSSITGPSLDIAGCAASHDAVARFASALKDIDGVTRVEIQNSTRSSDTGSNTGSTSAAAGGTSGCPAVSSSAQFAITAAFDNVEAAAASTIPTTPTPPASSADQSQVADAQQQEQQQRQSTEQQTKKARDNVSNILPGTVQP